MCRPSCWGGENTAQPACQRVALHICISSSLTSIRRHSAVSPPTLHGWPHLRVNTSRKKKEKKRGPSVVQTQTSGFYGSLTVLSWLQECVDCVTVVVVVVGDLPPRFCGSHAAADCCLFCSDLMEIFRRLLKCSEARHSYKDWIEGYKKWKWAG